MHNVPLTEMRILLWCFQNMSRSVNIAQLRREGILGPDGRTYVFANENEVVSQLRHDGWVIETDRCQPSRYIFHGHYDDYASDVRQHYVKKKWVKAPPHLHRTRPKPGVEPEIGPDPCGGE